MNSSTSVQNKRSTMSSEGYQVQGSRTDSTGVVKSLFMENTFTNVDSFMELYQNSDDAMSTRVNIKVVDFEETSWLLISDNGKGMTMETIDHSLNLLGRSSTVKKHGKFNFGGKAGILYLSDIKSYIDETTRKIDSSRKQYRGRCIVRSKHKDDKEVCYFMKGKTLCDQGWNNNVHPQYLDENEATKICYTFQESYPFCNITNDTGTKILIELTETKLEELEDDEENIICAMQMHCNERLNECKLFVSLSKTSNITEIQYVPILKKSEPNKCRSYELMIYESKEQPGKYIFVVKLENKSCAIKPIGKSKWSQDLESIDTTNYTDRQRKLTVDFDCDYTYTKEKQSTKRDNSIYVNRNGFCLNYYKNENPEFNKRAGDYYKRDIGHNIRTEIKYRSSDFIDTFIGINMQKCDIKWTSLPLALRRTIDKLQTQFYKDMCKYITENEYNPLNPKPHYKLIDTSETDEETDKETDEETDEDTDRSNSIYKQNFNTANENTTIITKLQNNGSDINTDNTDNNNCENNNATFDRVNFEQQFQLAAIHCPKLLQRLITEYNVLMLGKYSNEVLGNKY